MANRGHVPKFGNWEAANTVPYTQYFDNARKGRTGGKLVNPNDPQENPEAFSTEASPTHGPPLGSGSNKEAAAKSKHERRSSRDDGDSRRPIEPLRQDAATQKLGSESSYNRQGDRVNSGQPQRRGSRTSGGSDQSIEQSPLHPHYHAKSASRGGASPSWERKASSEGPGHAPNTPGRSRMRSGGRVDDTPDKGSAVPKFGAWDESNPASADGFTHIFNRVREEKKIGAAKSPIAPNYSSSPNGQKQASRSESVACGCFGF